MPITDLFSKVKATSQKRERKKALKTAAMGASVGVTVGVAAGVLLAPKSGKETRDELTQAAKKIPAKAREIIKQTQEMAAEIGGRLGAAKAEGGPNAEPK